MRAAVAVCLVLLGGPGATFATESLFLSSSDLGLVRQGWGAARQDLAVTGRPLSIGGRVFENGIGTHARSVLGIRLDGAATRFTACCGVDDAAGSDRASVTFRVIGDGRALFESGAMKLGQAAVDVDVSLAGVRDLFLVVGDGGDGIDYDHADWALARIDYQGAEPRLVAAAPQERRLLTPPAPPAPRINGPRVHGCRSGHPFLYRIPCTGKRPLAFAAEGLPASIHVDRATGILSGTAPDRGEYRVTLRAEGAFGSAERPLTIVSGDLLCLTPPLGWNHWYAHYDRITDALVREAADLLVSSGMADAGYRYVAIDDCWMNAPAHADPERVGRLRSVAGDLIPNRHFPDMRALTDFIHARGLLAGIYTSPGPFTCAGFAGSHGHEAQDARQIARWGFDLLKYDWCSYGRVAGGQGLSSLQAPYRLMGALLAEQDRDIVLNLCQYGMGDVWEWGKEVGGHSWRTGGDLGFELDRIFEIALSNCAIGDHNAPGGWNDPDYLQIGWIGNARGMGVPAPCPSSPNEQYAFMSLWCLLAAPLFYSGDLARLDEFTLNVLCNTELIEVNQDPLGQCARAAHVTEDGFILIKDLADGARAVGLCNRAEWPLEVAVTWADLGVAGRQVVRDLWLQEDVGTYEGEYRATVPPRFVHTLRIRPE